MPQTRKQRVGRWGEAAAVLFFTRRGDEVLQRNVRTKYGEIDLVVFSQEGILIFVEVKTRTNGAFGLPEEAVDARKLDHIFRSAEVYIEEQPQWAAHAWRIDVVAIQGQPGSRFEDLRIEYFENISA